MKRLKDFTQRQNQERIRKKLLEIYLDKPISFRKMAEQMKVNHLTLNRFLNDGKDVDSIRLILIEKWIKKREDTLEIGHLFKPFPDED